MLHSPAHTAHQRPAGEGLWEYLHNGLPSQWGKSENFAFNDISMQMAHISAFQQRSSPITFIVRATKYCDCKFVYIKDYVNRSTVSVAQKKKPQTCSAFTILLLAELGVVHSTMYSKNSVCSRRWFSRQPTGCCESLTPSPLQSRCRERHRWFQI